MTHSRWQQQLLGLEFLGALRLVYADALRPKLLAAYVAHNSLGPAAHALLLARAAAAVAARRRRSGHDAVA